MNLTPGTTDHLIARLFPDPTPWEPRNRPPLEPHQLPPDGRWNLWILEAGRGAGKTEACSRYFTSFMRANPGARGRIIAPTYGDAVEACIEGPSGLKAVDPEVTWLPSAPGGSKVVWPNGSEALVLGTHSPNDVERLRAGGNRHLDWWEEMAANRQLKRAWEQAEFGLRLGDHPHSIASTTPRFFKDYRDIRALPDTVLTHGSIHDNPHLNQDWKEKVIQRYAGTTMGAQELEGRLIEETPGALWRMDVIEAGRVDRAPELVRVAVALDPAATSSPDADDTGILIGGLGIDGRAYVLEDATCHIDPAAWGARAVHKFEEYDADIIVGEVNNGGEMVAAVIHAENPLVPFQPVHASRGKQTRAQPVAVLYGNPDPRNYREPMVHHVGVFPELEEQLVTWVPGNEKSPDRLDALVWLITYLLLTDEREEHAAEYYEPVTIGPQI